MPEISSRRIGNSGSEERFVQLFCEAFGPENGQYVYMQYPFVDIYGKHRTIDYAMDSVYGKIAIEIDGNQWHEPGIVSEQKYHDDLLKQNSIVYDGWKIYRWTSSQIDRTPERVKDELITFLGASPLLKDMEDGRPSQSGSAFSYYDHQKEALKNLKYMRDSHESIALLYHATGSGKTVTAISDAKAVGRKTLFLAHTKEIVEQAYRQFKKLWPEVSVGLFVDRYKESDAYVVCGTVQGIAQNLEAFHPDQFGYLIIDECHHGTAESYRRVLSYFKPKFTLGLTATAERADGEDLLAVFQNVAHKLDIKDAVEAGVLCPVRCIRVKTNIDMKDVRINGFQYNNLDLETVLRVPGRNKLIVDTYDEFVKGEKTVVFCTSVRHAEEMAALFRERGYAAYSVSGGMNQNERKSILSRYENGDVSILCACDLLNEGWDSPHTQVLFMARPTMSKTIYSQQLGRGMRNCEGKEFLMVFDFVDNANLYNAPYSLHRLLGIKDYRPGGLVLSSKKAIKWDNDMFAKGVKPDALIDYPIDAADYEAIDLFNWQEIAKDMYSQVELTRRVSAQSETIERYIKDGKLVPDMEIPVSDHRSFKYFKKDRVSEYAQRFGWTVITPENMKDMFMEMCKQMTMSYSYKPVFLLAFFDLMDKEGNAVIEDVARKFAAFYEDRAARGLPAEKKPCIFTKGGYTDKDVERLILSMPFKRFEDMHFIRHSKHLGLIQLDKSILRKLSEDDVEAIRKSCQEALERYFN